MDDFGPHVETAADDLLALAASHCDDALTDADARRLESLLDGDAEAQALYVDYTLTHAALAWHWRGRRTLIEHLPTDAEDVAEPQRLLVPRSLGERIARGIEWSRHPVHFILTVVVIGVVAWLGFATFVGSRSEIAKVTQSDHSSPRRDIARLARMHNAEWGDAPAAEGELLTPGRRLDLTAGLAEIAYENGTTVVIEGPALLIVGEPLATQSATSLKLKRGRLAAKVAKQTVGFAVETPGGRIVDLGTEFGVAVRNHSRTDVVVFAGAVRAELIARDGSPRSTTTVRAGASVRIDAEAGKLVTLRLDERKFTRALPKKEITPPLLENGSFEFPRLVEGGHFNLAGGAEFGWRHHPDTTNVTVFNSDVVPGVTVENAADPAGGNDARQGRQFLLFNTGGQDAGGTISQTVKTIAGREYRLTYSIARTGGESTAADVRQTLRAAIDDGENRLAQRTDDAAPCRWTDHTLKFTAAGEQVTITFSNPANVGGESTDLMLDGVQLDFATSGQDNIDHPTQGETEQGLPLR